MLKSVCYNAVKENYYILSHSHKVELKREDNWCQAFLSNFDFMGMQNTN